MSILDFWQSSKYASVTYIDNKHKPNVLDEHVHGTNVCY